MAFRGQELDNKKQKLVVAEQKLQSLEDKVLDDVINGDTYRKGYKKFSMEIARLKSEISDLTGWLLDNPVKHCLMKSLNLIAI